MNEFENNSFEEEAVRNSEPSEDNITEETPAEPEEDTSEKTEENKPKRSILETVYDYLETFSYALGLMMLLLLFVFRMVSVDGSSMETTLHDHDKLIIYNLFYSPETGDIVVINPESNKPDAEPIIKRVIATEGQKVRIDYQNWAVYVDGVKLDEPYIEGKRMEGFPMNSIDMPNDPNYEFEVQEGKVFVMGDNRNGSADSRDDTYGQIDANRILGRAVIRLAPDFGIIE